MAWSEGRCAHARLCVRRHARLCMHARGVAFSLHRFLGGLSSVASGGRRIAIAIAIAIYPTHRKTNWSSHNYLRLYDPRDILFNVYTYSHTQPLRKPHVKKLRQAILRMTLRNHDKAHSNLRNSHHAPTPTHVPVRRGRAGPNGRRRRSPRG